MAITPEQTAFAVVFRGPRPQIVTLCGSTRFGNFFHAANLSLTVQGHIVLSIGCDTKQDDELDLALTDGNGRTIEEIKDDLDELHKRKIDLCDWVLVVSDETGYFGDSTLSEIEYAERIGKKVKFDVTAARERYLEIKHAGINAG